MVKMRTRVAGFEDGLKVNYLESACVNSFSAAAQEVSFLLGKERGRRDRKEGRKEGKKERSTTQALDRS
jgi:hypothetical protein